VHTAYQGREAEVGASVVWVYNKLKGIELQTSAELAESLGVEGPMLFGQFVNRLVADPREPRTLLTGARTGHLGPTIFHSDDGGRCWTAQCRITGRRRQCLRGSIARSNAAIPMAADGIPA
jgi:hypothetical protein